MSEAITGSGVAGVYYLQLVNSRFYRSLMVATGTKIDISVNYRVVIGSVLAWDIVHATCSIYWSLDSCTI